MRSDVAVSHAYVHIIEFGTPVEIAGLKVNSGDLLHGDQHGFQMIPLDLVKAIPTVAAGIRETRNCRRSYQLLPFLQILAGHTARRGGEA